MKRLAAAWRVLIGVWWPREMPLPSFLASSHLFAPDPPKIAGLPADTKPEKYRRPKYVPSRVLVRHVLRSRLEAARDLANVLFDLEHKDAQVNASFWLADKYGGEVMKVSKDNEALMEWERPLPEGRRGGAETYGRKIQTAINKKADIAAIGDGGIFACLAGRNIASLIAFSTFYPTT